MNPAGPHTMNGYRPNNIASTSSDSFDDFHPRRSNQNIFNPSQQQQQQQQQQQHQQQHTSQSMPQHLNTNVQWQDLAMQMNNQQVNGNHSSLQQQQQQAFNQMPWANQMSQPQTFSNGMPAMGAFGMPFIPQQILQEAYAMSTPVEASDEPTLLTKLLSSSRRGESYKDALNSLHGRNGHSASLWKDYYLDNRVRLDAWIAMCLQKEKETNSAVGSKRSGPSDGQISLPTAKKPSPASFKREPSPQPSSSRLPSTAPSGKRPQKKHSHSTPPIVKDHQPQASRRSTINSLTAPSPVFGSRLPAPNADVKIPDPPSRSPSPPTNIIPQGRGNKYTQEDREFFVKFIGWRLKQNPSLARSELCELLEQKAPHHTSQSWYSHWSNNHDVPDKILAAARGEEYKYEASASSEDDDQDEPAPAKRRPTYKDVTTSEESSQSESEHEESEDDDSQDDDSPLRSYSEKAMGVKGSPFTDADLYITAKYISTIPDWEETSGKDRWGPHHDKFPQRSAKAWAEYYRRNERALLKLAKRIKSEGKRGSLSSIQCARPTRSLPNAKRKYTVDSDDESSVKRGREV